MKDWTGSPLKDAEMKTKHSWVYQRKAFITLKNQGFSSLTIKTHSNQLQIRDPDSDSRDESQLTVMGTVHTATDDKMGRGQVITRF